MPSPLLLGFKQCCPQCQKSGLFAGILKLKPACESCGFDLASRDPADGPAFLVITLLGFLVTGLAVWVELAYEPPFLLQLAAWTPITTLASLYLLRVCKVLMIAYEHQLHIGEETTGEADV